MVAAPGVTRFVGAGGFEDALATSNEMAKICEGHNPTFSIPTWDFQGTCLGIDIRKVVDRNYTNHQYRDCTQKCRCWSNWCRDS